MVEMRLPGRLRVDLRRRANHRLQPSASRPRRPRPDPATRRPARPSPTSDEVQEPQGCNHEPGVGPDRAEEGGPMTTSKIPHPTLEERHEAGKAARERTPRLSHRAWVPADDRPDPVSLLVEQDESREQDLVPVRHGRMMVSPFTFYRGAARIM